MSRAKAAPRYHFQLFVAGQGPNSGLAQANLQAICERYLPGKFKIEIVDVLVRPEAAVKSGVLVTPTLVRKKPAPTVKVIGNLTAADKFLAMMGLNPAQP